MGLVNTAVVTSTVEVVIVEIPTFTIKLDVEVALLVVAVVVVSAPANDVVTMLEQASEIRDGRGFTARESDQSTKGKEVGTFGGSCCLGGPVPLRSFFFIVQHVRVAVNH
jgi:hypothetical protein